MKKSIILLLSFCFVMIQSCLIPTLHPLYTEDVLVQNEMLDGHWKDESKSTGEWIFEEGDNDYFLIQNDGNEAYFDVHLIKLGNDYFLDYFPVRIKEAWEKHRLTALKEMGLEDLKFGQMNDLLSMLLLPIHTFSRVTITKDEVRIWMFDPEWLENLFENRKIRIKHERLEDIYFVTASSEELQKFVKKYVDVKEAYMDYDNPIILKRISQ